MRPQQGGRQEHRSPAERGQEDPLQERRGRGLAPLLLHQEPVRGPGGASHQQGVQDPGIRDFSLLLQGLHTDRKVSLLIIEALEITSTVQVSPWRPVHALQNIQRRGEVPRPLRGGQDRGASVDTVGPAGLLLPHPGDLSTVVIIHATSLMLK